MVALYTTIITSILLLGAIGSFMVSIYLMIKNKYLTTWCLAFISFTLSIATLNFLIEGYHNNKRIYYDNYNIFIGMIIISGLIILITVFYDAHMSRYKNNIILDFKFLALIVFMIVLLPYIAIN